MPLSRGFPIKGVQRLDGSSTRGKDRIDGSEIHCVFFFFFFFLFLSSSLSSRKYRGVDSPSILRSAVAELSVSREWV